MRAFTGLAVVVSLAALSLTAFAQLGGLKSHIQDQMNDAVNQHNQDVDSALTGNDKKPPQAPPQAGAIKSGWITRKSKDGKDVRLYFASPADLSKAKPAPGLIVLQEWWGVNEDMQERTRNFATRGFYAVAPDLFYGKVTDDATKAAQLKDSMTDTLAMTAMKTGLDLLQEEGTNGVVDSKHVGAIGWCMGGQQSLLLSVNDGRVKATALFYGPLVADLGKLQNIQGPILGIFGNNDNAPSQADVDKFKANLKAAGRKDVTIYQFDGVGHAFASKSAEKMGLYNEEKSKDAWDKMWAWLDQKLPRK